MDTLTEKAHRRAEARRVIGSLAAGARASQSLGVAARVQTSSEWQSSRRVMLFVPLPDEVDIRPLLEAALASGKQVTLPSFDGGTGTYLAREIQDLARDLTPGRFGIPEPGGWCRTVAVAELDFLLVPGLAFDLEGGRLGRGKGFYDRLLSLATGGRWGAAFEEQVGPRVPREAHDQPLHGLFTAAGLHAARTPTP